MRVGDFEVVAEDLVEADLQVGDARPLGFFGLVAGDPLLAAAGQLAKRVEFGVEAVADEAAVAADQRAIVVQRRVELAAESGHRSISASSCVEQHGCVRAVSLAFTAGSVRSVRPRKLRSRGLARPVVTRASSRSTS